MVVVDREVLRTYVADDGFQLPPLTELFAGTGVLPDPAISPVVEGEPVQHRLVGTYFDTVDLHLASAGLTLRRRTGGEDAGWHLKGPAGPGARSEVRLPPGRGTRTVPVPLQKMVGAEPRLRAPPGRRDRDGPDGAPVGGRDRTRAGRGGR